LSDNKNKQEPQAPQKKDKFGQQEQKKTFGYRQGQRQGQRQEQSTDALIEKVLFINRTTKVTKGGKNLGFSALVVVGDGESRAGFALGKANEVANAIRKGINKAKTQIVPINKKATTIPHSVIGAFGAVRIMLKPAGAGTGVIASSPVRAVCECAGIKDILTKNLGNSTNQINVVKATFEGLSQLKG
jgi:small subunit ribosomal protein S5